MRNAYRSPTLNDIYYEKNKLIILKITHAIALLIETINALISDHKQLNNHHLSSTWSLIDA